MRVLALLLVLAALGAGGWWWWQSGLPALGATAAAAYETEVAELRDLERLISVSGRVEPLVTVDLSSEVSGRLGELLVDYNSKVAKDEVIARIDPEAFETRVRIAEADLAVARANVSIRSAQIRKAEATLEQAQRSLARQRELARRGTVAEATLETTETQLAVAAADLQIARADLENSEAIVRQNEARLEEARIDLDRTAIRSPIDGVVIDRLVDVGVTVAASLQAPVLFTIAQDLSLIRIATQVNEADVGQVRAGQPARFRVDAFPERRFGGIVHQVRLTPIELTNVVTYWVIIDARNPDQDLYPGMTVAAEIITGQRQSVLSVPVQAIRFRPRGLPAPEPQTIRRGEAAALRAHAAALLELTPDQIRQLEEAVAERAQRFAGGGWNRGGWNRGGGGGGGGAGGGGAGEGGRGGGGPPEAGASADADPLARRQRQVERLEALLQPLLTPDQRARLERERPQLVEAGFATLWAVPAGGGAPEERWVRTGLADDSHVEILAGPLAVGDAVVVRALGAR